MKDKHLAVDINLIIFTSDLECYLIPKAIQMNRVFPSCKRLKDDLIGQFFFNDKTERNEIVRSELNSQCGPREFFNYVSGNLGTLLDV